MTILRTEAEVEAFKNDDDFQGLIDKTMQDGVADSVSATDRTTIREKLAAQFQDRMLDMVRNGDAVQFGVLNDRERRALEGHSGKYFHAEALVNIALDDIYNGPAPTDGMYLNQGTQGVDDLSLGSGGGDGMFAGVTAESDPLDLGGTPAAAGVAAATAGVAAAEATGTHLDDLMEQANAAGVDMDMLRQKLAELEARNLGNLGMSPAELVRSEITNQENLDVANKYGEQVEPDVDIHDVLAAQQAEREARQAEAAAAFEGRESPDLDDFPDRTTEPAAAQPEPAVGDDMEAVSVEDAMRQSDAQAQENDAQIAQPAEPEPAMVADKYGEQVEPDVDIHDVLAAQQAEREARQAEAAAAFEGRESPDLDDFPDRTTEPAAAQPEPAVGDDMEAVSVEDAMRQSDAQAQENDAQIAQPAEPEPAMVAEASHVAAVVDNPEFSPAQTQLLEQGVEQRASFGNVSADEKVVVSHAQEKLASLGYELNPRGTFKNDGIDGLHGSVTTEAVKQFQRDNGLEVDGEIDKDLMAKIDQKVAQRSQSQGVDQQSPEVDANGVGCETQAITPENASTIDMALQGFAPPDSLAASMQDASDAFVAASTATGVDPHLDQHARA